MTTVSRERSSEQPSATRHDNDSIRSRRTSESVCSNATTSRSARTHRSTSTPQVFTGKAPLSPWQRAQRLALRVSTSICTSPIGVTRLSVIFSTAARRSPLCGKVYPAASCPWQCIRSGDETGCRTTPSPHGTRRSARHFDHAAVSNRCRNHGAFRANSARSRRRAFENSLPQAGRGGNAGALLEPPRPSSATAGASRSTSPVPWRHVRPRRSPLQD